MKGKSISALKAITREQLLGNYNRLGTFVILYYLLQFTVVQLLFMINLNLVILNLIVNLIQIVFSNIFVVGMYNVCMMTVRGGSPTIKDYFYALKHDPDKIVIVSALMWGLGTLIRLPLMLPEGTAKVLNMGPGMLTFLKCIFMGIFILVYVYVSILISQWIMLYLDRPDLGAAEMIRLSASVMSHHKLRYFYLLFNQAGFFLLVMITLSIGAFWLMPFMCVLNINFYEDIREEFDGYSVTVE